MRGSGGPTADFERHDERVLDQSRQATGDINDDDNRYRRQHWYQRRRFLFFYFLYCYCTMYLVPRKPKEGLFPSLGTIYLFIRDDSSNFETCFLRYLSRPNWEYLPN